MTRNQHPTDEILLEIINDKTVKGGQRNIETHISNCNQCQTRLMSLANNDWLDEFRDCLSSDLLSETAHCGSIGAHPQINNKQLANENEYETDAIHKMLGKVLAPPTHPETLGRLGRYEVESVIGAGGMGLVLRGYDRELQRPAAIKMMLPRLANNGTAKQRFTREARAVAAILHPNVVAIHGIDETNSMPWFAMPFIAGPSLRELVEEKGPLPEREIARIGLQIASGLAAAHSQGLVHRDIKPENILVDNQINRVIITDFGLARRDSDAAITQTGILAGTLNYMSPEQTRGEDVDGRSDLFSLGALLYYLATGSTPFRSNTPAGVMHQISNEQQVDARSHNPEISKALSKTINVLLEKKPAHRFQSAVELEHFFEGFVSHLNKPTKHRLPSIPKFNHYRIKSMIVAVLAVLLATVATFWMINGNGNSDSSPSAEALWKTIQTEHKIASPSNFQKEVSEFEADVERMARAMGQIQDYESDALKGDAIRARGEFDRMDSAVSRMEAALSLE